MRIILSLLLFIPLLTIAQNSTRIITPTDSVGLQGMIHLDAKTPLYIGQEYKLSALSNGSYDQSITIKNGSIELIESSKTDTGPLRYRIIPIDSGKCEVTVGSSINSERNIGLIKMSYSVVNCPEPPIYLNKIESKSFINHLDDSTKINCHFPRSSGIQDEYEVSSWKATIARKVFKGKGRILSKELIDYLNGINNEYLCLEVVLKENKTGHLKSKANFFIRRD